MAVPFLFLFIHLSWEQPIFRKENPMTYFTNDFVSFFSELSENNNREWFAENKQRYETSVKHPFEQFMKEILHRVFMDDEKIQLTPKEAIFRIYRDVRFSKDKSPYKTHASAVISSGGRKNYTIPGYYLELSQAGIKFYAGAHILKSGELNNLRKFISEEENDFSEIINDKKFRSIFGDVLGEKNRRIPKEFVYFAEKNPIIYNKQFYVLGNEKHDVITTENLTDIIMEYYHVSKPFVNFLAEGISDNK